MPHATGQTSKQSQTGGYIYHGSPVVNGWYIWLFPSSFGGWTWKAAKQTGSGTPFGQLEPSRNSAAFSTSSSREVRIRVPFFPVVYFSRGTLPPKRVKGHDWGTQFCISAEPEVTSPTSKRRREAKPQVGALEVLGLPKITATDSLGATPGKASQTRAPARVRVAKRVAKKKPGRGSQPKKRPAVTGGLLGSTSCSGDKARWPVRPFSSNPWLAGLKVKLGQAETKGNSFSWTDAPRNEKTTPTKRHGKGGIRRAQKTCPRWWDSPGCRSPRISCRLPSQISSPNASDKRVQL